jgi:hypothetical protein
VLWPLRWREVSRMLVARRSGHDELRGHDAACAEMAARSDRMSARQFWGAEARVGPEGCLRLQLEATLGRSVFSREIVALLVLKMERERERRRHAMALSGKGSKQYGCSDVAGIPWSRWCQIRADESDSPPRTRTQMMDCARSRSDARLRKSRRQKSGK